ncbi:hypothetical protein FT663_05488, partial [Candidozyma haemuli var. vulneris]
MPAFHVKAGRKSKFRLDQQGNTGSSGSTKSTVANNSGSTRVTRGRSVRTVTGVVGTVGGGNSRGGSQSDNNSGELHCNVCEC